jgi:peptidase A4-like protein
MFACDVSVTFRAQLRGTIMRAITVLAAAAIGLLFVETPVALAGHKTNTVPGPSSYAIGSWGGYAVGGSLVTDVKAAWKVPSINCGALPNTTSSVLIWVGIGGFGTPVEQTGITITCSSSGVVSGAFGWVEFFPAAAQPLSLFDSSPHPIAPGDVMTAEVSYTGKTNASGALIFEFRLNNQTQNWSFTLESVSGCQPGSSCYPTLNNLTSAEWAVEPCCELGTFTYAIAPFSPITFTSAAATIKNGNKAMTGPIDTWGYADEELCLNNAVDSSYSGQTTTAVPTPLDSTGTTFNVIWGDTPIALQQGVAGATTTYLCQ